MRANFVTTFFLGAAWALAPACSSPGAAPDAGTDADGNVGELFGTFRISLIAPRTEMGGGTTPGHTTILGKVYDGSQPETVIWQPKATSGGCTLSTPRVPFCSPGCGSSAACVADNTCKAYPTSQSVGAVHVEGVGAAGFDLTAVSNSYQVPAGTTLPYPAFAEGDVIGVRAAGSAFTSGAFTLGARGVATLDVANTASLALQAGRPLSLSWTAPGAAASSRVQVKLDISHHGGSKGKIECDVADTGALSIDAAMVDQLLALGAAGFPTIILTRATIGRAAVAGGHVDLIVASEVEAPIAVPGVVSCTEDTQCTPPQTCQSDLTCK